MNSSIEIIFGPMFSGKTTELFRRLSIFHAIDKKVLYINSDLDNRTDLAFSSHNKTLTDIPFSAIKAKNLSSCQIGDYDVIAVDEAHFFPDLKEVVLDWADNQKKVVLVAGLNGDYQRQPFGQINDLIPLADNITKLFSYCISCKNKGIIRPAHFTKRIISGDDKILIGGKESYIAACRECYKD